MIRVTSLLSIAASALGLSFAVRALTEMKIWCIVSMHMLKVVRNEYNLGVKGLLTLNFQESEDFVSKGNDDSVYSLPGERLS